MSYLGSWKIDDFLTFYANTHMASTGAQTDADAVPTYRVYEDETTAPILTGSMALLDAVNTDGFYSEQIQLTAANGFEKGKSYSIRVQATVSTVVAAKVLTLQIEAEVNLARLYDITLASVEGTAPFRGLAGAVAALVNRVDTQTGALRVFETDDTVVYGTKTLTTDPNADPIVEADTV